MNIINYSTQIDAYKTTREIQDILVKHGAQKIMFDYEDKQPVAIRFVITDAKGNNLNICLPARPLAVQKILVQMKREKGSRMQVKPSFEQACKVGWRIIKEWIEAQMALIQTEQAEMAEVFLPYIMDRTGKTFFQNMKERNFLLTEGAEL